VQGAEQRRQLAEHGGHRPGRGIDPPPDHRGRHLVDGRVEPPPDDAGEEVVLRREVPVDGRGRHAAPAGDLGDRHGVEAGVDEGDLRGVEERRSLQVLVDGSVVPRHAAPSRLPY
jgi:hypothetical protein